MSLSWFKFNVSSLLITGAGLLTAGFFIAACYGLWSYTRLEERALASVSQWKIIEKSSSEFALKARYKFLCRGETHKGKTIFSKPYHLNRPSAEKQIQDFTKRQWTVWYDPTHPSRSSLERVFPTKKCLYSLMTLGVFLYFLSLNSQWLPFKAGDPDRRS